MADLVLPDWGNEQASVTVFHDISLRDKVMQVGNQFLDGGTVILGIQLEECRGQFLGREIRFSFDEINQFLQVIGQHFIRFAETPFNRANERDTLGAAFVDGKMHPAQSAAQVVGRLQREPLLSLKQILDRSPDRISRVQ